jgi:succinate dehydrogenase / fumarate reductase iron-sulfur subunit
MNFTLRIWRQQNATASGSFITYQVKDVTPDMSFLEMLDALNEDLLSKEEPPVAFEHDCREGICGSCGFLINGVAHGGPAGYYHLPTLHALFQRWRRAHIGAVACPGVAGRP